MNSNSSGQPRYGPRQMELAPGQSWRFSGPVPSSPPRHVLTCAVYPESEQALFHEPSRWLLGLSEKQTYMSLRVSKAVLKSPHLSSDYYFREENTNQEKYGEEKD